MFLLLCIIWKCWRWGSAAGLSAEPVLSTGETSASAPCFLCSRECTSCWLPSSSPSTATTRPFSMPVSLRSQGKFLWELHLFFSPVVIFFFNLNTFYIEDFVNCKHLFVVHVAEPLSNCNPISAMGKLGILNIFVSLRAVPKEDIYLNESGRDFCCNGEVLTVVTIHTFHHTVTRSLTLSCKRTYSETYFVLPRSSSVQFINRIVSQRTPI